MNIQQPFTTAVTAEEEMHALSRASILEARHKEQRIREFFNDPFQNGEDVWYLENLLIDYLRQFKTERMKRKNGVTEEILHEFDPILFDKILLQTGFLPDKVTYQKINGAKILIPESQQSIRLLFGTLPIHDLDEDFYETSRKGLEQFLHDEINDQHKNYLHQLTKHIGQASDAITFGRKTFDSSGEGITIPTHDNDLQKYISAMEEQWYVIAAKSTDRLGGMVTRLSRTNSSFKLHRHIDYMDQTRNLFMMRQTLENMSDRYPQLHEYFDIINANLKISLTCLETIMQYHPALDREKFKQKGIYNPNTARTDIHRFIPTAMRAAEYTPRDICPMTRMLEGLSAEAYRYPELQPIVDQIHKQLAPSLARLGKSLSIKAENKSLIIL